MIKLLDSLTKTENFVGRIDPEFHYPNLSSPDHICCRLLEEFSVSETDKDAVDIDECRLPVSGPKEEDNVFRSNNQLPTSAAMNRHNVSHKTLLSDSLSYAPNPEYSSRLLQVLRLQRDEFCICFKIRCMILFVYQ